MLTKMPHLTVQVWNTKHKERFAVLGLPQGNAFLQLALQLEGWNEHCQRS